ncbi:MAG TPA: type II secretion system protein GspK, partial [Bdellovibrionota bacterium]|nr:type II secretion system protein GspK [Bdellovibrionota bacterium]
LTDMAFNTSVNDALARNQLDSLSAEELSRSGVEMAILELEIYKQMVDQVKGTDPISKSLRAQAQKIIQFGFVYPIPIFEDLQASLKDELQKLQKGSNIRGSVKATITDLGGRININHFAKTKELSEVTRKFLTDVINVEFDKDEETRLKYRDFNAREIVGDIEDYIDPNKERVLGGEENLFYEHERPPRRSKNLPLDDVSELLLVRGMTDDIYKILNKQATIYGEAINVNTAPKEILIALIPGMDEKELAELLKLRDEQPFADQADFEKYAKTTLRQPEEFNTNPKIPLTGTSQIYKIESVAQVGQAVKIATVIVEQTKDIKILSWEFS